MQELKGRIGKLQVATGAVCPLCGQSLSEEHRRSTLEGLEEEGRSKGDRYRANQAEAKALAEQITEHEAGIKALGFAEQDRLATSNSISQLSERLENLERQRREWEKAGAKRLKEVEKILEGGKYATSAQKALAKLDKELAGLGYDAAAHDAARGTEMEIRSAEEQYRRLESAREVSKQIEGETAALQADANTREAEIREQQKQYEAAASALAAAEADAPNLEAAEDELLRLREQENQVRDEVGAARQKVGVLTTLASFLGLSVAGAREGIHFHRNKWVAFLVAGTLLGATSSLYDRYLLGRAGFRVPTVQAWFSVYLVVFFVPKFEDLFARLRERNQLPPLTEGLLWLSGTMRSIYGVGLLALIIAGAVALQKWLSSEKGSSISTGT